MQAEACAQRAQRLSTVTVDNGADTFTFIIKDSEKATGRPGWYLIRNVL